MQKSKVRASSLRAPSRGQRKSAPSKILARRKAQPAKPGQLLQPAKPGQPLQPAKPGQPLQPAKPGQPHQPRKVQNLVERGPVKRGRAKLHPNLSSACDELHATVMETENAANRILAAAEELGRIADMTGTPAAKRIVAVAGGIFEASAFQDITGQRIRKVIGLLREMENPRSSTGLTNGKNGARSANKPLRGEKALLNGPQLAGEGCSQSDIDALLASMD